MYCEVSDKILNILINFLDESLIPTPMIILNNSLLYFENTITI
jgi:hypothetical protein